MSQLLGRFLSQTYFGIVELDFYILTLKIHSIAPEVV